MELIFILVISFMYKDNFFAWVKEWSDFDSFYGLGFFILAFFVYFAKTNYEDLKATPKSQSPAGIILIIVSLFLYIVGNRASMEYLVNLSFPMLISGTILSLYGFKFLLKLLTPLSLLAFILPIFPLHRLTMPLQMLSTVISSKFLSFLGLHSFNEGNILYINNFRLAIVAGCSGLKSLFSLLSVCIMAGYLEKIPYIKRGLYIFLAVPLAIGMNILRISITALYGLYNGEPGLEQFHDYLGLVINVISIIVLIFIIRYFGKNKEESS